jgi:hypothetical protein
MLLECLMPSMPADQLIDQVFRLEGTRVVILDVMRHIADALIQLEVGQPIPPLVLERFHNVPVPDGCRRDARELLGAVLLDLERQRDALGNSICTVESGKRSAGDSIVVKPTAVRQSSRRGRGESTGRLHAEKTPQSIGTPINPPSDAPAVPRREAARQARTAAST